MAQPPYDPTLPAEDDRLRVAEQLPPDGIIERVEERAVMGRRQRDTGGVRVTTRTEIVPELVTGTLEQRTVEVERVPVGRFVEAEEGPRVEGDLTVVPVYEERLVVEKRLYLVEEVHLRRLSKASEVEVPVELRRQVADVERLPPLDGLSTSPDTHQGVNPMMDDSFRGSRSVTAMFDNSAEAERAISRLRAAGVPQGSIRHTQGSGAGYSGSVDANDTTYRDQHQGFFDSLADFFFPEEDRYTYAEGLSRGSHMVVVTDIDSGMHDTIVDILDDEGSIDLDERENEWRSSGWSGYEGSDYSDRNDISGTGGMAGATSGLSGTSAGLGSTIGGANTRGTIYDDGMQDRSVQMAADSGRRSQADLGSQQQGYAASGSMRQTGGLGTEGYRDDELNEDGTVKVVEENLTVGKRAVEGGGVKVRSYMREEPVSAEVDLRATRVHVERRPVDRAAGAGDFSMRDQVLEARETAEEAVVSKQARVVEEIGLRSETETHHETVQDTVRKTEVEIEDSRTGDTSRNGGTDRDRF